MELIDNAVDSRIPKTPLNVEITVHPQSLVVTAVGGEGMGIREIERNYLRWGGSPKRGRQLLVQYGQGGKAAIGHLGRRFSLEASRPGDDVAWRFTDVDNRDRSRANGYALVEAEKPTPAPLGCVLNGMHGLAHERCADDEQDCLRPRQSGLGRRRSADAQASRDLDTSAQGRCRGSAAEQRDQGCGAGAQAAQPGATTER